MAADELEELEQLEGDLKIIRDLIQKYTDLLKSERDLAERAKYKRRRKFLRCLEGFQKDKISRHHLANRIKQWEEELSSPAIDSAPRVPGYLSKRQFVETLLQAGRESWPFLHAKVLQNECDFAQLIVEFDGWEVLDEISKQPAPEGAEPAPLPATPVQSGKKRKQEPGIRGLPAAATKKPSSDKLNLSSQAEAPCFTHSEDYRKLGLDGATHTVTADQAAIFRCLAQAYKRGLAGVSGKALLVEVGSPSSKVRNFFQREGMKVYRDLIAYDKHSRLYRLRRKPILSRTN